MPSLTFIPRDYDREDSDDHGQAIELEPWPGSEDE